VTFPRFQRTTLFTLLALVALVAAACQAGDDSSSAPSDSVESTAPASVGAATSDEPSDAASAGAGEETSVFDLEVGDCFTSESTLLDTVLVVDCEEPHVYEVYDVGDVESTDDAYPGDAAMGETASAQCQDAFEAYVGIAYEDSQWYVTSIPPSEETWAEGDREVVCLLHLQDESEVTGSAEGSGE
jgi:hypothetical protein